MNDTTAKALPELHEDERALLVRIAAYDDGAYPLHHFEPPTEDEYRRRYTRPSEEDKRKNEDRSRRAKARLSSLVDHGLVEEAETRYRGPGLVLSEAGRAELDRLTAERDAHLLGLAAALEQQRPRLAEATAALGAAWKRLQTCRDEDLIDTLTALSAAQGQARSAANAWGKALHDVHQFVNHTDQPQWPDFAGEEWPERREAMLAAAEEASGIPIADLMNDHKSGFTTDTKVFSRLQEQVLGFIAYQHEHRDETLAARSGEDPAPRLAQVEKGIDGQIRDARDQTARTDQKASLFLVVSAAGAAVAAQVLPGMTGVPAALGWSAAALGAASVVLLGIATWPRTPRQQPTHPKEIAVLHMVLADDPETRIQRRSEEAGELERLSRSKWKVFRTSVIVLGTGFALALAAAAANGLTG